MQLPTAIVKYLRRYSSHRLAVCAWHTLSIVTMLTTTTCSVLTSCSNDASTTMQRHRIPPAKQPSKHRHVRVNRNQSQIKIEFNPATPASKTIIVITASTASHVQFVIPIGISTMSDAGSSVCTTPRSRRCRCRCRTYNHNKCYQSVNNAITTNLCC